MRQCGRLECDDAAVVGVDELEHALEVGLLEAVPHLADAAHELLPRGTMMGMMGTLTALSVLVP